MTPAVPVGAIHHVGFIVREIGPAEAQYVALGYTRVGSAVEDDRQDAAILFLERAGAPPGEPLVELVCPRSERSPVYAFSIESRLRIHHVCFAVDDLDAAVAALRARRVTQVMEIAPAPAIGGSRIAFFFARETGLFELVERPPFGPGRG